MKWACYTKKCLELTKSRKLKSERSREKLILHLSHSMLHVVLRNYSQKCQVQRKKMKESVWFMHKPPNHLVRESCDKLGGGTLCKQLQLFVDYLWAWCYSIAGVQIIYHCVQSWRKCVFHTKVNQSSHQSILMMAAVRTNQCVYNRASDVVLLPMQPILVSGSSYQEL